MSHAEAAAALAVSERTLRRWRQRYEEEGVDGLVDWRVREPSPKRAPEDELERMRALYQQDYRGFTIKHFHEKFAKRHDYKLGYTTTRIYLQRPVRCVRHHDAAPIGANPPPADARHAAASGRLEGRSARRAAAARPDHYHG